MCKKPKFETVQYDNSGSIVWLSNFLRGKTHACVDSFFHQESQQVLNRGPQVHSMNHRCCRIQENVRDYTRDVDHGLVTKLWTAQFYRNSLRTKNPSGTQSAHPWHATPSHAQTSYIQDRATWQRCTFDKQQLITAVITASTRTIPSTRKT